MGRGLWGGVGEWGFVEEEWDWEGGVRNGRGSSLTVISIINPRFIEHSEIDWSTH